LESFVNWKQVGIFSLVLFLALVTSGIPFGYMLGSNKSWEYELPTWYPYAKLLSSFFFAFVVFIIMAVKYHIKPFFHAFCIFILVTIVSIVLELILIKQIVVAVFIAESVVLLLALVFGTYTGKYLTKKAVVTNT